MGFFKDFKRDFAQAVNELMPENGEMAGEYDDEDMVNTFDEEDDIEVAPEDLFEDLDDFPAEDEDDIPVTFEPLAPPKAAEPAESVPYEEKDPFDVVPEAEMITEQPGSFLAEDEAEVEDSVLLDPEIPSPIADEEMLQSMEEELEEAPVTDEEADLIGPEEADGAAEAEEAGAIPEEESLPEEMPADEYTVDTFDEVPAENPVNFGDIDIGAAARDAVEKEESFQSAETSDEVEAMVTAVAEEKKKEIDSILTDDTTYITKGTRIKGDIITDGGIDVIGNVEGSVTCQGKLICGGGIHGSVKAGELYANAAKIEGEINVEGGVKIGVGSVIIGNITATSAMIAGAINGDIDVQGPVIVDSTAVIMGNIKSRSVQINNGAVIEGFCSQCYSEIDVKSFFE